MSKRASPAPVPPVRAAARVVKAATRMVEQATDRHDRQLALAELWRRALQAEAEITKVLGTGAGETPDFPVAATAGEPADAAAVAVIGEARAIVGAEAAKIIREADGPQGEHHR